MRNRILPFLLIFFCAPTWAQVNSAQQDSLFDFYEGLVTKDLLNKEYVDNFIEVDRVLYTHNPTKTVYLTRQMLLFAEENKLQQSIEILLNRMGVIYREMGLNENAYHYFLRDKIALDKSDDLPGMGFVRIDLGNIFYTIQDYAEAKRWYLEAIAIADSANLQGMKGTALNNLGIISRDMGDYEEALEYFSRGMESHMANNERRLRAHSLRYFASVYHLQGQYDREVDTLIKSLEYLSYAHVNRGEVVPTYLALANAYEAKNNLSIAQMYLQKADSMAYLYQDADLQIDVHNEKGEFFLQKKNYDRASKEFELALDICNQNGFILETKEPLQALIDIQVKKDNYPKAFEWQVELIQYLEWFTSNNKELKVQHLEFTRRLSEAELELEKAKREKEENEKELMTSRYYFSFVFSALLFTLIVIIIGSSLFFYRRRSRYLLQQKQIEIKKANEILVEQSKEKEKAFDMLQESLRAKSIFLSKMSHEIRTPMNAILGMLELMDEENLNEESKVLLKNLMISSNHLMGLIDDVLDYSKIDSGTLTLQNRPFDTKQWLENYYLTFEKKAIKNHNEFKISLQGTIPTFIKGDLDRINQVLFNLTNNALKFTSNGEITAVISWKEQSDHKGLLGFVIKDNGIGMTEDQQEIIFDEFTQAHEEIHNQFGGTGLGLAISKQIVVTMEGNISVESKLGEGSIFTVVLPLESAESNLSNGTGQHKNQDYNQFSKSKVLMVEDDTMNQFVAKRFFSSFGIELTFADNGKEGYEQAFIKEYDLIFMDIQMPVWDGFIAAEKIRQDSMNTKTPIVALTADIQQETVEKAKKVGMNDLITKPVTRDSIYSVLSEFLTPDTSL
ncbi:MAG: ATP-binding protein [Schleiferiaceae bacterium]